MTQVKDEDVQLNNSKQLMQWVAQGALKPEDLPQALALTQALPSPQQQGRFFSYLLLISGVLLLVSGVIFFFAFNWDVLHRYSKFAVVQGALAMCLLPLFKYPVSHPVGQLSLGAAALMVGACLALVGQTYQTGADSYQLFLVWAGLLVPWLLLTQQLFLMALILVLANLALWLYSSLFNWLFILGNDYFLLSAVALNLSSWLLLELYQRVKPQAFLPWLITAVFSWSVLLASILVLSNLGLHNRFELISLGVWVLLVLGAGYFYRYRQLHVLHLALLALSVIAYLTAQAANVLGNSWWGELNLLLLGGFFMGLSLLAGKYLQRLYQQAELGAEHE